MTLGCDDNHLNTAWSSPTEFRQMKVNCSGRKLSMRSPCEYLKWVLLQNHRCKAWPAVTSDHPSSTAMALRWPQENFNQFHCLSVCPLEKCRETLLPLYVHCCVYYLTKKDQALDRPKQHSYILWILLLLLLYWTYVNLLQLLLIRSNNNSILRRSLINANFSEPFPQKCTCYIIDICLCSWSCSTCGSTICNSG